MRGFQHGMPRPSQDLIDAATEEMRRIAQVLPGLQVETGPKGLAYWTAPAGQGHLIHEAQELLACWFFQVREPEKNHRKVLTASEMRL